MARLHVLIDTSVFLHILRMPGLENGEQSRQVRTCLEELIREDAVLYLPLTTILETGNLISQLPDGNQRRQTAERFVRFLEEALEGKAPWQIAPFVRKESLPQYLEKFVQLVTEKLSLGDVWLVEDAFERLRTVARQRGEKVTIWTFDHRLAARSPNPGPCRDLEG